MQHMMRNRRIIVLAVVLVAVLLVLAAARFVAYPAFRSTPDHVHIVVTRIQPPPADGRTTVFDQQFGAVVARHVYVQLVAGEPIPPNVPMSCPAYGTTPYYHYALTFSRAGVQTGSATSDAWGCETITLDYPGGEDGYSWHARNGVSFWERLNQLTGAPRPINADFS